MINLQKIAKIYHLGFALAKFIDKSTIYFFAAQCLFMG